MTKTKVNSKANIAATEFVPMIVVYDNVPHFFSVSSSSVLKHYTKIIKYSFSEYNSCSVWFDYRLEIHNLFGLGLDSLDQSGFTTKQQNKLKKCNTSLFNEYKKDTLTIDKNKPFFIFTITSDT